jgi:hypothetical protein
LDGKLVSGSLSAHEGSERESSLPFFTYTEKFNEQFPYYLSIGMTPEQYWDSDSELAKYYRKAEEIRIDKRNQEMWLQGMYVYEAICDASPILHDFAKKGTKPHPYADKPYSLNVKQRAEDAKQKEKSVYDKGKKFMEAFMVQNNAKFKGNVQ